MNMSSEFFDEFLSTRHPWALYGAGRKSFEEYFQRAQRKNSPSPQGTFLWEKIQLILPETKLSGILGRFVAITHQEDEKSKAVLWTHQSLGTRELVTTARLYHPSMGEDSLVYDCSNISNMKELWKLISDVRDKCCE